MAMVGEQPKFTVEVYAKEKPFRIPKEYTEPLKGVMSAKKLASLKKDAVMCPVLGSEVPFLVCFQCSSFLRRVKGVVHCSGEERPRWPPAGDGQD